VTAGIRFFAAPVAFGGCAIHVHVRQVAGAYTPCPQPLVGITNDTRKGKMTTAVDISTIARRGKRVPVIHCTAVSMSGALRIIDSAAPAPANPHVRRRLRREHGGVVCIGMVRAEVDGTP
jgi:hypothetical protein